MTENTKPQFNDILSLISELPVTESFQFSNTDGLSMMNEWLSHHSRTFDLSRGFQVNRCALYWAGYDVSDGFDGQGFVDSCQESQGSLRQLAEILNTDLQIFELDPHNHETKSLDDLAMAASYGKKLIYSGFCHRCY